MSHQSVKYGIDRCPATRNYSHSSFCRYCDFRASEGKDCCECVYHTLGKNDRKQKDLLH